MADYTSVYINKKKPKILVIGHIPPPQEGTAKLTELVIKSRFLGKYFTIYFLSLYKRKNPSDRGKFAMDNLANNILNFLNFFAYLFVFRPHIIYISISQNKLGFLRDSVFILVGKIFRRRLCVHFHGGSFNLFYARQRVYFKRYIAFLLRHIDKLILLAKKFSFQFIPLLDANKITILYNCLPETRKIETKKERDFLKNQAKVLFIGYISIAKGAFDLVKAIPEVISNYKLPIEFLLCGQPVDIERNIVFIPEPHFGYSKIKSFIAKQDLASYVRMYPEVSGREKERLFSDAYIFVLPSYSEGCAVVVLEAMSFGLPIITTPIGALEEMLTEGHNCFFVRPGDISGITEKILFLLNNPDVARRMGEANIKLVAEKYNTDIFLHNLSNVWSDIIKNN